MTKLLILTFLKKLMPTFGTHFPDNLASVVEAASKLSPEKKVGPYIKAAVMQRLSREGMMPGDAQAEVLAAVATVGTVKALAILRRAARSVAPKAEKEAA